MTMVVREPIGMSVDVPSDVAPVLTSRARALSSMLSLMATRGAEVARAAAIVTDAIRAGHGVLVCGNGGSAAEAQHLAGELVGRFRRERDAWPVLALTADMATITAVANDYGFENVFARQVAAFGRPGDVLIGFSTSGESVNVVNAARFARERGLQVIAFTGREPTSLGRLADVDLAVPCRETPLIQEIHTVLVHVICEIVEETLAGTAAWASSPPAPIPLRPDPAPPARRNGAASVPAARLESWDGGERPPLARSVVGEPL
jgi:D-sedoheptulose 7-phosphate isomerase